ncbi:hypothetical protein NP493_22g01006 [Ridgeia piscesae]|uniref:Uncharacterized protein n=1 Tax=Ridgeia piscesae TaxID=27915 RepID=A0AAD9PE00_RIDPI|nr:hypothetical protein NP493_22g01006 [Ridgeia piscesae]
MIYAVRCHNISLSYTLQQDSFVARMSTRCRLSEGDILRRCLSNTSLSLTSDVICCFSFTRNSDMTVKRILCSSSSSSLQLSQSDSESVPHDFTEVVVPCPATRCLLPLPLLLLVFNV